MPVSLVDTAVPFIFLLLCHTISDNQEKVKTKDIKVLGLEVEFTALKFMKPFLGQDRQK